MVYRDVYYTSPDGLRLYARDYGGEESKPTVLCLHGLTRNSADFEDLALHLAPRFRVICPDQRGRGKSGYASDPQTYAPPVYANDMAALLDHLGVQNCVVIGTSLGGLMAMFMAATMKERLLGVILNDIGPEIDPAGGERLMSYVGIGKQFATWEEAANAMAELNRVAFPHYGPDQWMTFAKRTCVERDGIIAMAYDLRIAEPIKQAQEQNAPDLWPLFMTLEGLPLLCIRGETSDILSPETLQKMHERMPQMESVSVPKIGHAPALDEAEARAAIDKFLAQF